MPLDWPTLFSSALSYDDFLAKYANENQKERWSAKLKTLSLSDEQKTLLASFTREMHVLCLSGAWCGDCVDQCPMFQLMEQASPNVVVRYIDRDDAPDDLKEAIQVCGGNRVPVVVFLNEDDQVTGMYGDRTLAKYRQMVEKLGGAACSTGISLHAAGEMDALTCGVLAEWIDQFERNQWICRTSTRLREKHGD
ncbi:thiol reductase thioredoxin [Blastopirellula marina]|uniref:Thiol reductase thioredoxin n=1 Tax=Blastopirellula marina TaxID=124 RepID=A0A2S8G3G0_9BACT|nr:MULTISPECIES: thioredoxin family protein [Pirellulaceae]PQO38684.1 thiol reductase thioredoxin [Blastopirellula marina]RCS54992.1 thiol reductase thioredoxin [Bremerella cremea]